MEDEELTMAIVAVLENDERIHYMLEQEQIRWDEWTDDHYECLKSRIVDDLYDPILRDAARILANRIIRGAYRK